MHPMRLWIDEKNLLLLLINYVCKNIILIFLKRNQYCHVNNHLNHFGQSS
jgi:hypothetical protein